MIDPIAAINQISSLAEDPGLLGIKNPFNTVGPDGKLQGQITNNRPTFFGIDVIRAEHYALLGTILLVGLLGIILPASGFDADDIKTAVKTATVA